jgi:hypothetical protein
MVTMTGPTVGLWTTPQGIGANTRIDCQLQSGSDVRSRSFFFVDGGDAGPSGVPVIVVSTYPDGTSYIEFRKANRRPQKNEPPSPIQISGEVKHRLTSSGAGGSTFRYSATWVLHATAITPEGERTGASAKQSAYGSCKLTGKTY